MNDEHETADGHMGDPVKPGEPTVRLSGEHLVVAFCSVLDTLTENSKELAQKDARVKELESRIQEQVNWRVEDTEKHEAALEEARNGQDSRDQDSRRLDILHDFAKKHGRVLIISDTRGFGVCDDSARMMQPPFGLNDYRTHLRDAIDGIGSETQEGGAS